MNSDKFTIKNLKKRFMSIEDNMYDVKYESNNLILTHGDKKRIIKVPDKQYSKYILATFLKWNNTLNIYLNQIETTAYKCVNSRHELCGIDELLNEFVETWSYVKQLVNLIENPEKYPNLEIHLDAMSESLDVLGNHVKLYSSGRWESYIKNYFQVR